MQIQDCLYLLQYTSKRGVFAGKQIQAFFLQCSSKVFLVVEIIADVVGEILKGV